MDKSRRNFLLQVLGGSAAAAATLLIPQKVLAGPVEDEPSSRADNDQGPIDTTKGRGNGFLPKDLALNMVGRAGIADIHYLAEQGLLKNIVHFPGIMPDELWTEVIGTSGVWRIVGVDETGKMLVNTGFLEQINRAGYPILRCILLNFDVVRQANVRFILLNGTGKKAYTLAGIPVVLVGGKEAYDPEKFQDEKNYRIQFAAKYGLTLDQINQGFREMAQAYQAPFPGTVIKDVAIGSPEWDAFLAAVDKVMPHEHQGIGGVKYPMKSWLPRKDGDNYVFAEAAQIKPGFDFTERFQRSLRVDIALIPEPTTILLVAAISLAWQALTALFVDDWRGFYEEARVLRGDLAPTFRLMGEQYRGIIFSNLQS